MDDIRFLDFEKDYLELKTKLDELKDMAVSKNIDMEDEIRGLEARVADFKAEKYQGLTAWQKYQMARHPDRPTTLDYIQALFEDFIELHGIGVLVMTRQWWEVWPGWRKCRSRHWPPKG